MTLSRPVRFLLAPQRGKSLSGSGPLLTDIGTTENFLFRLNTPTSGVRKLSQLLLDPQKKNTFMCLVMSPSSTPPVPLVL